MKKQPKVSKYLVDQAYRIASLTTNENPVSILKLGKLHAAVLAELQAGSSDELTLKRARELIPNL